MMQKLLFITAHEVMDINFYSKYSYVIKNQWKCGNELLDDQERSLKNIIKYAYKNVPYYHYLFKKEKIDPYSIKTVISLNKIPILNKKIINDNWDQFIPINIRKIGYITGSTGGTTGTPLNYRITNYERALQGSLLYRGWGYAGYKLSDKMIFIGGSSLDIDKINLNTKLQEVVRNIKKLSAFDMGAEDLKNYYNIINLFKPKFIRGYPSAIFILSKWMEENDLKPHQVKGIFTTSEKLLPNMKEKIENVFQSKVYDGYGLNDGGLSAFECKEHNGMHIDTERSVIEVINDSNENVYDEEGIILATTLFNFSMPFIRYNTEDLGIVTKSDCVCGRRMDILKDVSGRTVDLLVTPEGKIIHGWFFLYIFWSVCKGIDQYQVVQKSIDEIYINLVINKTFDYSQIEKIKDIISQRSKGWKIYFNYVDKIEQTKSGKTIFIKNEYLNK